MRIVANGVVRASVNRRVRDVCRSGVGPTIDDSFGYGWAKGVGQGPMGQAEQDDDFDDFDEEDFDDEFDDDFEEEDDDFNHGDSELGEEEEEDDSSSEEGDVEFGEEEE